MNTARIKRLTTGVLVIGLLIGTLPVLAPPVMAQDGDELTESFVTKDGALSFNYPAGWHAEEHKALPGLVLVGTSAEVVQTTLEEGGAIPSGELVIEIVRPEAIPIMLEGEAPETLEDALAIITTLSSNEDSEFGEPEVITLAGQPALLLDAKTEDWDGVAVGIDFDGSFMIVAAVTAPGEYGDFADTVLAILDTLVYAVPQGMILFEAESVDLSFEYPAGWIVQEYMEGRFMVANELFKEGPGSGQLGIYISTPADSIYVLSSEGTAELVATAFVNDWISSGQEATQTEAEAITVGETEGIKVGFASEMHEGFVIVFTVEDEQLLVLVFTAADELADFEADAMAVIESIAYTPAPAE